VGAQAGLVLARALIGRGDRDTLRTRLAKVRNDLMTLMFAVALMLIWAGVIEAFFSQYHAPVLPYGVKIAFGTVELVLLVFFFGRCGREKDQAAENP
ncbi:MAG TPA: stage II sporulation protein M, partial [Verrucomicrobiae bacterium]|nr:stage II sporulation protein M [Verrucomicrobiae bacterium]